MAPLLRNKPDRWLAGTAAGLAVCVAAVALQAAVHELNTGKLALIAHGQHDHPMIHGEFVGYPQFGVVLLSPTRGVFWVTPIVLLALVGFAARPRAIPWWGWASLLNALVQTGILAFWNDPGQGDSFGIRLWAEHVPVVVCGLAVLTTYPGRSGKWLRAGVLTIAFLCVAWTALMCRAYILGRLQSDLTHWQVLAILA